MNFMFHKRNIVQFGKTYYLKISFCRFYCGINQTQTITYENARFAEALHLSIENQIFAEIIIPVYHIISLIMP